MLCLPFDEVFELSGFLARGKGTDGGFVVDRRAAKKRQSAGPVIIKSASALLNKSSSRSLSAFACVSDDRK